MRNKFGRIGYFTEGMYFKNGNGSFFSSDIFIIFFQKIFSHEKILTIGRISKNEFSPKYIFSKNNKFIDLSFYKSITRLLLIYPIYILKNRNRINYFINNIDVLFISASGPMSILLLRRCRKRNKQVVIFIRQNTRELIKVKHNNTFLTKIVVNLLETQIEKFVGKYSKAIVFTFGSEIYSHYSKLSNSVYSIADSRFHSADILRKIDKVDYSYPQLLYVGRLAKGKGLEFLIESLAEIKNFKFGLTIVGEGVLKEELIRRVDQLKISELVNFKGHIPFGGELLDEYSSHDIFILPSFSEGFPQVIIEAMARGALVVATKVGGIPDLIQDGVNGFLYAAGNKKEFIKIINKVQSNTIPELAIRKNALVTAKKYSFESQAKIIYSKIKFDN